MVLAEGPKSEEDVIARAWVIPVRLGAPSATINPTIVNRAHRLTYK
jgi:hypothetical protein